MTKTFFNQYEAFSSDENGDDARSLFVEVASALNPIFLKYLAKGYPVREIEGLMFDELTNLAGELRMIRASEKMRQEKLDNASWLS